MEVIEVRGIEYKFAKARDFEVIVRSDNGFINYTKLCQQINDGHVPFRNIKMNEEFKRLCIQMENNSAGIPAELPEVSLYEQIKDRIEITETGSSKSEDRNRIAGTYMPRYLLDYVIMTCDISYYKLIHELIDVIDQVAQEQQVQFVQELQDNIELQRAKLERKKLKISRLEQLNRDIERRHQETMNELQNVQTQNTNLNNQITEVRQQNNQLLEDNRITHNKIDQIGEQITGLTDLVGNDLNELNLTTSTARYVYIILTRPALITEMRDHNVIDTYHSCFDSLCCLRKDRNDNLVKHGYNADTDRIELEYECSCSLDLSKWITRHFNRITCSNLNTTSYKRKIIYLTRAHDEVLADIADYIARTTHVKETIINRLEHLQTIVENQNEQIQELREEINQLQVSLNEHRPGATKIQSNRLFRDLEIRNGSIYFKPSARDDPIELTLEMIMNGNIKFRDANGRIVNLH